MFGTLLQSRDPKCPCPRIEKTVLKVWVDNERKVAGCLTQTLVGVCFLKNHTLEEDVMTSLTWSCAASLEVCL